MDAVNYNSDSNLPTQATLMDSKHVEHYLVDEIGPDADNVVAPSNHINLINDEINKQTR